MHSHTNVGRSAEYEESQHAGSQTLRIHSNIMYIQNPSLIRTSVKGRQTKASELLTKNKKRGAEFE